MATPTFDLQWFSAERTGAEKLYLVRSDTPFNQILAQVSQFGSSYRVAFHEVSNKLTLTYVPVVFDTLDDAKAYARVTCLLTLKVTLKGKS